MFMRSNKNAVIFLDRDGTIIEDGGHLKDPSEVVSGIFEAAKRILSYHLNAKVPRSEIT